MTDDLTGLIPESWNCIDCDLDTAPGCFNRQQMEQRIEKIGEEAWERGGIQFKNKSQSEIYIVHDRVWKDAGNVKGCLCIGCLEKRLGRKLRPKDFQRKHPFNDFPSTPRLLDRKKG